jgi:Zn ribbon nucleic-acid-binding protein
MTHLTIETVECPGCGHTHRIEVDTEKALKEAKEDFNKKHKDWRNGKKRRQLPKEPGEATGTRPAIPREKPG